MLLNYGRAISLRLASTVVAMLAAYPRVARGAAACLRGRSRCVLLSRRGSPRPSHIVNVALSFASLLTTAAGAIVHPPRPTLDAVSYTHLTLPTTPYV